MKRNYQNIEERKGRKGVPIPTKNREKVMVYSDEVQARLDKGETIKSIADSYGVNYSTFRWYLSELGVECKRKLSISSFIKYTDFAPVARKMTVAQAAEYFHCSEQVIRLKEKEFNLRCVRPSEKKFEGFVFQKLLGLASSWGLPPQTLENIALKELVKIGRVKALEIAENDKKAAEIKNKIEQLKKEAAELETTLKAMGV